MKLKKNGLNWKKSENRKKKQWIEKSKRNFIIYINTKARERISYYFNIKGNKSMFKKLEAKL
jgi:hypothetical protein